MENKEQNAGKINVCKENITRGIKDMLYHTRNSDEREFEINLKAVMKSTENNLREIYRLRNSK